MKRIYILFDSETHIAVIQYGNVVQVYHKYDPSMVSGCPRTSMYCYRVKGPTSTIVSAVVHDNGEYMVQHRVMRPWNSISRQMYLSEHDLLTTFCKQFISSRPITSFVLPTVPRSTMELAAHPMLIPYSL